MKFPKHKPERDPKYLAFIRKLPCMLCATSPCHPHHEGKHGVGTKASDYTCIPLCPKHHDERHRRGKGVLDGIDVEWWQKRLYNAYRGVGW